MVASIILLKSLLNTELDEVMSKRRPPTAGTFAQLAVASAVACAVLPEVVDLAMPFLRHSSAGTVSSRGTHVASGTGSTVTGPRVMGSYHAVDDGAQGVDRFRFAAGTPFDDESAESGAMPDINRGGAGASDGTIPDRIAPAAALEPAPAPAMPAPVEPSKASDQVKPSKGSEQIERQVSPETAPAAEHYTATAVEDAGPALATPVARPDAAAPAPTSPLATQTTAAAPAGSAVVPVAKPVPVSRGEPRAAEPHKATVRKAASTGSSGNSGRSRRQSASADDEDVVAKPAWRPENLNNWPN